MTAVDDRVATVNNAINPVSHAQVLRDNAVTLIKNVLTKASSAMQTNAGFTDLESA